MISFDLQVSPKTLRNNHYSISRSSQLYIFLRNEYPNLNGEYDHLLNAPKRVVKRIFRKDFSVKVPQGSKEHLYYKSEYRNSFSEDLNHNIIVPEEEIHISRRR